jgi:hypothetical protein
MAAPPLTPKVNNTASQPVQRFAVRLSDGDDQPDDTDETKEYRVESIKRSAGGQRLDTAEFTYATEKIISDIKTPVDYRKKVDVIAAPAAKDDEETAPPADVVFRGEMGVASLTLDDRGQQIAKATARTEQWHFGAPLVGWRFKMVDGDSQTVYRIIEDDVRFNPEIDRRILNNRSNWSIDIDADTGAKWYTWVDPESVRTEGAQTILDQSAEEWTLAQAVMSLCYLLNPDEEYIKNPDFQALAKVFDAAPVLRDWTIPRGVYLPEALDKLLVPHGYLWFVRYSIGKNSDDEDEVQRRITVFKRGTGTEKTVLLPAEGEARENNKANVAAVSCEWNIAEAFNIVQAYGSHLEVEGTFELQRAWAATDDSLTADALAKSTDPTTDLPSQYEKKPDVWRKWVLNEAGDYTATRSGNTTFDVNTIYNRPASDENKVALLGTNNISRRRKFYSPLTKRADDGRRDVLVEYRVPADAYADVGTPAYTGYWKDVLSLTNGHYQVLERECGILFTGQKPPEELIALGADARIRITACLRSDQRISYTTPRAPTSPNAEDIKLVVDLSGRFHKRKRVSDSPDFSSRPTYTSRYTDDSLITQPTQADTADDTTALETYAIKLRDQEQSARVSPQVTLEGYHPEYEIGDIIKEVEGRGLSFNSNAATNETKRYPQITGIEFTQMTTVLTLQTFDDIAAGV